MAALVVAVVIFITPLQCFLHFPEPGLDVGQTFKDPWGRGYAGARRLPHKIVQKMRDSSQIWHNFPHHPREGDDTTKPEACQSVDKPIHVTPP